MFCLMVEAVLYRGGSVKCLEVLVHVPFQVLLIDSWGAEVLADQLSDISVS